MTNGAYPSITPFGNNGFAAVLPYHKMPLDAYEVLPCADPVLLILNPGLSIK